ncbi:MAG: flagellar basal body rod protein FlgB [Xanthobacteraceae bacterium]|nr:flagellar basal body rod protein FlgB [Xanthobacteraceae bacterium]
MAITDLPMLSMLKTKMQWHQERQRVLSENVSNSDTPGFKPRDLVAPKFEPGAVTGFQDLAVARTSSAHIQATGVSESFGSGKEAGYETRPTGNAVSLEDEMLKVASNQMDYAAVAGLYSKSLGLIKIAIGRSTG